MNKFWSELDQRGRGGLVVGVAVIVLMLVVSLVWVFKTDYQVLFSELRPQDSAAMVAELERQKVPFRIGNDGNSILVPADIVHATRLKLMGREIPMQGHAGFELFNNADFGMTEFAQKINYQRALQGELTRTILSLAEVREARVHLALAEEGLFKRANAKAKAAITLGLRSGASLAPEQIVGIQRLVAAAVPGIAAQDVTIVDQRGVALTRVQTEGDAAQGSGRLDLKREMEVLLARKASDVLERAFGAGQAIATVDVTLNMDLVRTTSEEVLGSQARGAQGAATGVVVREREVVREGTESAARDNTAPLDLPPPRSRANNTKEVEYQTGRRVEQVVSQPGAVRRIQAVAVVSKPISAAQLEQVRSLLAAAVGAMPERGDTVVVQTIKAFDTGGASQDATTPAAIQEPAEIAPARKAAWAAPREAGSMPSLVGLAVLLAAAALAALVWVARQRHASAAAPLSAQEREAALRQLKSWLHASADPAAKERA